MLSLLNFITYQTGWFVCVLGAAHGMPWLGTIAALAVTALNISLADRRGAEIKLALLAGIIGFALDSILVSTNGVSFTSGTWIAGLAPHWMIALWISFATTFNSSLRWLTSRPLLATIFGFVGGPLAYLSGEKLGALTMHSLFVTLLVIGMGWAIAMLLLTTFAARLNRTTAHSVVPT